MELILIDYNQVGLAAIFPFQGDLKKDPQEAKHLIRHIILSNILQYRNKYGKEYGEIVICCDAKDYWRKDVFPFYKGDRKKKQEDSGIDFKLIFDTLSSLRAEIKETFPYKVMYVDKAEADDVIAVLCEWSQDNELVTSGICESPQKMIIISEDMDFPQLQKWKNISQFAPRKKKMIKMSKQDLYEKYITHIVKAGDDGIPNILSADDVLVTEGVRQTPVSAKRLAEFIELGKSACRNDIELRNWDRNERLVSFEKIPQEIKDAIIDEYIHGNHTRRDTMKIMNYLAKNNCRLLLNDIGNF